MLVVSLKTDFVPSGKISPPSDSRAEPTLTEASHTARGGQKKTVLREVSPLHRALVPPCGSWLFFLPEWNSNNLYKDFSSRKLSHWFY